MKKPFKPTKYAFLLPVIAVLVCVVSYAHFNKPLDVHTPSPVVSTPQPTQVPTPSLPTVTELFNDTNVERVKNGLQPLVLNEALNETSQAKCDDEMVRNYWNHTTPDGQPFQTLIRTRFDHYTAAGENNAVNTIPYTDAAGITSSWMNSPGHKANILNPQYTDVGYAICHSDSFVQFGNAYLIVQQFVGL